MKRRKVEKAEKVPRGRARTGRQSEGSASAEASRGHWGARLQKLSSQAYKLQPNGQHGQDFPRTCWDHEGH